ncbi:hypothetical protein UREG_05447 [Uncinocarpus reesii 1704]|uniref:Transcription factor n=1 Tax=Uncinocarpus reesii (strain UAMH 1704) TaxID=336963 RepID=C4JSK8_UNCRE|nr:uncharacterized protein UREG_05447 [Uncinocarpus reesii 1704]EEP80605.1 hypothetical protein UREG_05447 [Uncinocarpus reesii 1704]
MEGTQAGGTTSTGNSSDFVRKLYKMLEDPSYAQIVRWGDDRDSFVVLECEKFTKSILPKHFKHSNFASFVRQLNKYDFHKVRQNNEETGQSPYGPGAWEFKHPEFKADNKDSLDNIRRKAPAPRKPAQSAEDSLPTHQLDLMNQQLGAQQQQFQHLADRFGQFSVDQQIMMQEIRRVQKTILSHEQIIHYMMNFLQSVDVRQRRENRAAAAAFQGQPGSSDLSPAQAQSDEPASPLQRAMKILSEMNSEIQFNMNSLESMGDMQNRLPGAVPTPPLDQTQRNGAARPPTSTGPGATMAFPRLNGDLEQVVYPVGVTNGIDPIYGDQMNNIPYPIPSKDDQSDPRRQFSDRKKSTGNNRWKVPLFLFFDGLEAVNKIQTGSKYDLILMDIIMPNLDGVSACSVIRRFDATPIIAMTSNIRSSDIDLYFQNGMNDVLPKPFTRQSLLNMLEKHLVHLKSIPSGIDATQSAPASAIPQNSATQSVKEETTPGQSPGASIGNWQSPAQFPGVSPINVTIPNQFIPQQAGPPAGPFTMDQNGSIQYSANQMGQMNTAAAPRASHRRQVSDMSSGADAHNLAKRQRMFANNAVVNPMQTSRMP